MAMIIAIILWPSECSLNQVITINNEQRTSEMFAKSSHQTLNLGEKRAWVCDVVNSCRHDELTLFRNPAFWWMKMLCPDRGASPAPQQILGKVTAGQEDVQTHWGHSPWLIHALYNHQTTASTAYTKWLTSNSSHARICLIWTVNARIKL